VSSFLLSLFRFRTFFGLGPPICDFFWFWSFDLWLSQIFVALTSVCHIKMCHAGLCLSHQLFQQKLTAETKIKTFASYKVCIRIKKIQWRKIKNTWTYGDNLKMVTHIYNSWFIKWIININVQPWGLVLPYEPWNSTYLIVFYQKTIC